MSEPVSAHKYLLHIKQYGHLPFSREQHLTKPSSSELWRWLQSKSVLINGQRPGPKDLVTFPVTELVFFPKGKSRTTFL